jgi:hypothetical protein
MVQIASRATSRVSAPVIIRLTCHSFPIVISGLRLRRDSE